MRRGRHAADDGSFGRSASVAAGRGALLLAIAVVLGIILLNAADDSSPRRVTAGSAATTEADDDGNGETATTAARNTTTTTPLRAPRDVKVLAANGTTAKGAAGKVSEILKGAGYNVLAPTDTSKPATASNVYFTATFEREAQAVALALALQPTVVQALPTPPPVTDLRGANILVVLGPDLAQRVGGTRSTSTTTTTARPSGTSTTTTTRQTTTTTAKP